MTLARAAVSGPGALATPASGAHSAAPVAISVPAVTTPRPPDPIPRPPAATLRHLEVTLRPVGGYPTATRHPRRGLHHPVLPTLRPPCAPLIRVGVAAFQKLYSGNLFLRSVLWRWL